MTAFGPHTATSSRNRVIHFSTSKQPPGVVSIMYPSMNPSRPNRTSTLSFPGTSIRIYKPSSHVYVYLLKRFWKFRTVFPFKRHIMYAQDERKRDVVIKLVETDSVEHPYTSASCPTQNSTTRNRFHLLYQLLKYYPHHTTSYLSLCRGELASAYS